MASAINNGTFSFNPEELKDWSKVIHELTFGDKELNEIHDIQTGIKHDEQIVFAQRGGRLMGKKVKANCTPNEIAGTTLTQKFWRPVFEDFRLKHCTTDVNQQDKLINQMARMNPDYFTVVDGSQRSVGDFMVASVIADWKDNATWKAWFNDLNASTFEDSDGSQTFTNGTDVEYFSGYDGLFKQIFAADTANSDKYRVTIAKNAGVTYAGQALASGEAMAAFRAVYNKADSRLRTRPDAKFLATRSLYDGLVNDLETVENSGGFTLVSEDGKTVLRYRGIEVVMMEQWDRFIDAYQNNGTVWNIPHRLVLTVPSNIPIGTLATDDFGKVEAFYDQYHKVNVFDGVYSMDAKMLEDYLVASAY